MTIFPKRVWTKKGMVFHDKKPVRQLGDKVGVYDPNFTEVDSGKVYPEKAWENVSATEELLIYDGEQPTEIGTFEDGLESTYKFLDYDGTVLKQGKVKDGETPVAPADPTREHYTFTGWNPTVGPITKNTTFTATYVGEPCTVSATASTGGTVSPASITVPYGSEIDATVTPTGYAIITIAGQTIEGEPNEKYEFYDWEGLPQTGIVTGDLTVNFVFHKVVFTVTFIPLCGGCYEDVGGGTIVPSSLEVHEHAAIQSSGNILKIDESHGGSYEDGGSYEETTVTATADSGYVFNQWTEDEQSIIDGQTYYVEDDITINALFDTQN